MNPFSDRCATATALIGVLLMVCTILTRVNPVEASVVRPEFLRTPPGQAIAVFLLITSVPGWIGVLLSMPLTALVKPEIAIWTSSLLVQFVAYWILGKVISAGWRRWHGGSQQAR
jgi:hypothetical protein